MFYIIYKITNKLNGKIYIGKHQTEDINDAYMGSGKHLKRAINKYGLENFIKEILFQFDNEADMNAKEAKLVTEEFVKEDTNYNLCPGGHGGFGYVNSTGKNIYGMNGKTPNVKDNFTRGRKTQAFRKKNDPEYAKKISEKISRSLKGRPGTFKGKIHTDETKKVIGEKNSKHQSGEGNSQYGKIWIYSLEEKISKKISRDETLPQGWVEGRKIKF